MSGYFNDNDKVLEVNTKVLVDTLVELGESLLSINLEEDYFLDCRKRFIEHLKENFGIDEIYKRKIVLEV